MIEPKKSISVEILGNVLEISVANNKVADRVNRFSKQAFVEGMGMRGTDTKIIMDGMHTGLVLINKCYDMAEAKKMFELCGDDEKAE